ncbi:MAG TPA: hypothetical protein VM681_02735 [Candidatus Thermoplasmatota archaeon]|nr:hypothetical protein [Candidatus Thermoplasmatota archaeon]
MRAIATTLALAALLSGCLGAGEPDPAAGCERFGDPVFRVHYEPGFMPYEFTGPRYLVEQRGAVVGLDVNRTMQGRGTGAVSVAPGALTNVTREEATAFLRQFRDYDTNHDFTIRRAVREAVDAGELSQFCGLAAGRMPALAPFYDHRGCADAGTVNLTANLDSGARTSRSYCGAGPPAFHDLQEAFERLAAGPRARLSR